MKVTECECDHAGWCERQHQTDSEFHGDILAILPAGSPTTTTTADIAGREFVERYGGRVCLVDAVPVLSTTDLIRRLQSLPKPLLEHEMHDCQTNQL